MFFEAGRFLEVGFGTREMVICDHQVIYGLLPFCFRQPINKIRWIHALMKPLICFSGEAFQKNAGIAKEHIQFWQAICKSVIPTRQPIIFKKAL